MSPRQRIPGPFKRGVPALTLAASLCAQYGRAHAHASARRSLERAIEANNNPAHIAYHREVMRLCHGAGCSTRVGARFSCTCGARPGDMAE